MTARIRRVLLASALMGTLGASGWTYWRAGAEPEPAMSAVPARPPPVATAQAQAPRVIAAAVRAPAAAAAPDLFTVAHWETVASAPPPISPSPPPPQAPPLPFEFFGRTEAVGAGGAVLIHLRRGKDVFSVRESAQIDDLYRLDRIGPDALEIVYLPLAEKQLLVIGSR